MDPYIRAAAHTHKHTLVNTHWTQILVNMRHISYVYRHTVNIAKCVCYVMWFYVFCMFVTLCYVLIFYSVLYYVYINVQYIIQWYINKSGYNQTTHRPWRRLFTLYLWWPLKIRSFGDDSLFLTLWFILQISVWYPPTKNTVLYIYFLNISLDILSIHLAAS